jgi:hypothetical protein
MTNFKNQQSEILFSTHRQLAGDLAHSSKGFLVVQKQENPFLERAGHCHYFCREQGTAIISVESRVLPRDTTLASGESKELS